MRKLVLECAYAIGNSSSTQQTSAFGWSFVIYISVLMRYKLCTVQIFIAVDMYFILYFYIGMPYSYNIIGSVRGNATQNINHRA